MTFTDIYLRHIYLTFDLHLVFGMHFTRKPIRWFFIFLFFLATFVSSAWSFVFFIPATTANDLQLRRIFYPRFYPLHLSSYLNSWERASIFPFECSVLNKGTTGTIFISSVCKKYFNSVLLLLQHVNIIWTVFILSYWCFCTFSL